jgi:hypothetical protein
MPLVGDGKYGGRAPDARGLALWSCALTLPHPRTGETVSFRALPPREGCWADFPEALYDLSARDGPGRT